MDRNSIAQRLQELKDERRAGGVQLQQLDARRSDLQQTLTRIDGAIQVLEELLGDQQEPPASAYQRCVGRSAPATENRRASLPAGRVTDAKR